MVVIITTTIVRGNWITLRGTRRMPRAGDGYGWHGYSLRDGGHRTDGRRPLETPSIFPLFRGRSTASFDSISGGGGGAAPQKPCWRAVSHSESGRSCSPCSPAMSGSPSLLPGMRCVSQGLPRIGRTATCEPRWLHSRISARVVRCRTRISEHGIVASQCCRHYARSIDSGGRWRSDRNLPTRRRYRSHTRRRVQVSPRLAESCNRRRFRSNRRDTLCDRAVVTLEGVGRQGNACNRI